MNRLSIILCAAAAATLMASCAKNETTGLNDASKRYLEAWMKIHHPEAVKNASGIYILEETSGSGKEAGDPADFPYAYVSYTASDLDGNIKESTEESVAKQLGTYDPAKNHYGPVVRLRNSTAMTAGQEMVLNTMRVGGSRKAVIPGWFNTSSYRYSSEEDYLKNVTGDDSILSVELHDVISDIDFWQIDSMARYMIRNLHSLPDSLKYGFYYIQTVPPSDTTSFDAGTSVYIDYTGSLLDGTVFDSTDEKTAKDAGIYRDGSTYSPMKVTMATEYTDISFSTGSGTGSFVNGFSYCLSLMRKGEKGTCIFYSGLGYEGSGKDMIPGFSPLRFDIEMIGTELK
jgi:FKBP-type peptidyl-prolyl cis-trans isomerase 2